MRYAAVTLLVAVLTASAGRAQSHQRESSASPPPKGRGPEVASVKPQPDSPLRLSMTTKWVERWENNKWVPDSRGYELATFVENVGDRAVSAFAIRHAPGDEIPGLCVWRPKPPGGLSPSGKRRPNPAAELLPPGESDVTGTWRGFSPSASRPRVMWRK